MPSTISDKQTSLEINAISIVLVGDFNPAIFQPHWLGSHGLITPSEAREAQDLVVHAELTALKLPWVHLQITHKQFSASTAQESHFETVRDMVVGIFSLLKHTPLQKMGINLEQHYRFADPARYVDFGHKLAPKEAWRTKMTDPRLLRMVVIQQTRDDAYQGHIQVDLERSVKVEPGVYFRVNDHFEWPAVVGASGVDSVIKILSADFQKSLAHSRDIVESILSIA